jgi:hypothetical protein
MAERASRSSARYPPHPLRGQVKFDLGELKEREHPMAFLTCHLGGDELIDIGSAIRIVGIGKERFAAAHGVANFAQRASSAVSASQAEIGVLLSIALGKTA